MHFTTVQVHFNNTKQYLPVYFVWESNECKEDYYMNLTWLILLLLLLLFLSCVNFFGTAHYNKVHNKEKILHSSSSVENWGTCHIEKYAQINNRCRQCTEYDSISKTPAIRTYAVHCARFTEVDYSNNLWQQFCVSDSVSKPINAIQKNAACYARQLITS